MSSTEGIDLDIRVLIVDDYALTRNMVKAILRGVGFAEVVQADDGAQAVQKIFEDNFGLVVCDWNMPRKTGIEVLTEVRAIPAYANLPFVLLTAEAYRENVEAAMKAGVSDYVIKPFTAEILTSKIFEVLKRSRANTLGAGQK